MEPAEFHWPLSALYSLTAHLMEPAYVDIADRIPVGPHHRTLLDMGGGDGRLAVAIARRFPGLSRIVTADISHDLTMRAQQRARQLGLGDRISADVQDAHAVGYEDDSFDVVVSFAALHHWKRPATALLEAYRVLRPGGSLMIIDGYDKPAFVEMRNAVRRFGGSYWTALVYWIGSKDVLPQERIRHIVGQTGLDCLTLAFESPLAIVQATKTSPVARE